jgi:hypothetical protein
MRRGMSDGQLLALALGIGAALALAACSPDHEPGEASASPCPPGPSAPLGVACGEAQAGLDASLRAEASAGDPLRLDAQLSVDAEAGRPALEAAVAPPSSGPRSEHVPCEYRGEPGHVKIVAIEDAGQAATCKVPQKRVDYVFTSSDAGVTSSDAAGPSRTGTIQIGRGRDPPAACLAQEGLTLGSVLPATYKTKIAGNCPVSYVDLGRSFESCIAACADPGDGL